MEEKSILTTLKERVPEYPQILPQHEIRHEFKIGPGKKTEQNVADPVFKGARLQSESKTQIAQFNRDSFVFSRLHPYETWENLQKEACRLWALYKELASPLMVNRVGVRFINKISLPYEELDLEDYLEGFPKSPGNLNLPFAGFFHQDTLVVPDYPYKINFTRTIQKPPEPKGIQLLLDIDVFNDNSFEINDDTLLRNFSEMRWLKNAMFFNCITDKTLEMLR